MKRLFVSFFSVFLILSCKSEDGKCNNKQPLIGTYDNNYIKGSENLLTLNKDGTFKQIFRTESETKINTGTWKYFKEGCRIRFDTLKFLHEIPIQYEEMNIYWYPATHRNDMILFQDHYNFSFNRQE